MIFSEFKPVVEPRMNVRLLPNYGFFKVVGVEPAGEFIKDFEETISPNSIVEAIEVDEVYMENNTMAQWRVWVLDDIQIRLNLIGRRSTRGTTKFEVPQYAFTMKTNSDDGLSQFFVFEDKKVFFDIHNPSQYTISHERVLFKGYKYSLEKLDYEPEKYTDIPIGVIR